MSQQGERSTGHEDDWWGQLYDDSTEDTGPTAAGDSLDDRFASAAGTVDASPTDAIPVRDGGAEDDGYDPSGSDSGSGRDSYGSAGTADALPPLPSRPVPPAVPVPPPPAALPPQRGGVPYGAWDGPSGSAPGRPRAPWEPPPAMPAGPASFPPGPKPAGFRDRTQPPHSVWATPTTDAPGDPVDPVRDSGPGEPPADSSVLRTPIRRTPTRRDIPALPSEAPKPLDRPGARQAGADSSEPGSATPSALSTPSAITVYGPPTAVDHVGSGPPTYASEPTALPPADPDDLGDLVADTVLDGAHYGSSTLRAVSLRGDSARFRGEPRRDSLLTARFGTGDSALVLIAMATGARATPGAHRAAAEACQWIGRAVGRSHVRLAEDIRAARRGDLKSGLHRLTDRSLGKLRASAAEQGIEPEEYTAGLRCLLLPADPDCRTRVFFGVGAGGLFRLRDGEWQDIEPRITEIPAGEPVVGFGSTPHETPDGDRLTMDLGITTPPSPYEPAPEPPREPFRFRASVARPGDTLLLCTGGLAEPLRGEPELCEYLTGRWSGGTPPGLAAFLADTQVRVKGYADDRTAAAVWDS
ncbi:protein phosphatase 2C domain-containing protein [Streptomyces geranii]|uniref:protein phosphatase 2C domain-containing protein n=1 Tax=Streptomyces geranii TaxID=2058923 RepID=UPI000D039D03|nr:protein phosphatase 2C domain-containing protein [Streptomyces geranii]